MLYCVNLIIFVAFKNTGTSTYSEKYKYLEIFERDNWTCQICKQPIDKTFRSPHPMSANLDHKKPLAKGGSDTPSNVQATHRKCNLKKSAKWD